MTRRNLVVAARARSDIRALLRRTTRAWGEQQSREYEQQLENRIQELREYPNLGTSRDDLASGVRRRVAGEHAIFYTHDDERVLIVRVLHLRMDESKHFAE